MIFYDPIGEVSTVSGVIFPLIFNYPAGAQSMGAAL